MCRKQSCRHLLILSSSWLGTLELYTPPLVSMTFAVLCCARLCCAVPGCAVLCQAVLCQAVLCCAVLGCSVQCCAVLRCAVLQSAVCSDVPCFAAVVSAQLVLCSAPHQLWFGLKLDLCCMKDIASATNQLGQVSLLAHHQLKMDIAPVTQKT